MAQNCEIEWWILNNCLVSKIKQVSAPNKWDVWYKTNDCEKSRTKCFPCCNLFILYMLRFYYFYLFTFKLISFLALFLALRNSVSKLTFLLVLESVFVFLLLHKLVDRFV